MFCVEPGGNRYRFRHGEPRPAGVPLRRRAGGGREAVTPPPPHAPVPHALRGVSRQEQLVAAWPPGPAQADSQ